MALKTFGDMLIKNMVISGGTGSESLELIGTQTVTTSGTLIPPDGTIAFDVFLLGGGRGGDGGYADLSGYQLPVYGGTGREGGKYMTLNGVVVTKSNPVIVTIGAGGQGGPARDKNISDGGAAGGYTAVYYWLPTGLINAGTGDTHAIATDTGIIPPFGISELLGGKGGNAGHYNQFHQTTESSSPGKAMGGDGQNYTSGSSPNAKGYGGGGGGGWARGGRPDAGGSYPGGNGGNGVAIFRWYKAV